MDVIVLQTIGMALPIAIGVARYLYDRRTYTVEGKTKPLTVVVDAVIAVLGAAILQDLAIAFPWPGYPVDTWLPYSLVVVGLCAFVSGAILHEEAQPTQEPDLEEEPQ